MHGESFVYKATCVLAILSAFVQPTTSTEDNLVGTKAVEQTQQAAAPVK